MIRLKWTDAPAGHLKVCRNKIDDFDKKTFEECYKFLKVTKMSTSSSTTSSSSSSSSIVIAISTRIVFNVLQGNAS